MSKYDNYNNYDNDIVIENRYMTCTKTKMEVIDTLVGLMHLQNEIETEATDNNTS